MNKGLVEEWTLLNLGDIIFQLFAILVPVIFIILIFLFIRSSKKRNERLKRIEEKIDNPNRPLFKKD